MVDWNEVDGADVACWLRNVSIDKTLADYRNDASRYEYAVLCRLATRIAPRAWLEVDPLEMSRLLADEARRRLPWNRKWDRQLYRSILDGNGDYVDRLTWDAERVATSVGRAQELLAIRKILLDCNEPADMAITPDERKD